MFLSIPTSPWLKFKPLMLLCLFLSLPVLASPVLEEQPMGTGDSIRITVFQNPDLTTEARISALGTVRLPLLGAVPVAGLTTDQAALQIATRLRDQQVLREPEVTVTLMQLRSRQVSVLGQVGRPGRYPLEEAGQRVVDMIAQAGGITGSGDETVTLLRRRDGQSQKLVFALQDLYDANTPGGSLLLESGDTILVPRAPVFYIYGEVQRAGAYRLEENLTVVQALSLGGGITRRGTERGLRIHRTAADGRLARIDAQPQDRVQAGDVIYVAESLF